jgi:hypothetical protein
VLAALVAEVAKRPFEDFVQRELFARARLETATLIGGKPVPPKWRTRRVATANSSWIDEFPSGFGRKGTTGALMSAEDLLRWDAALRGGMVLRAESLAAQAEAGPGGYGLGWFVDAHGPVGPKLWHSGSVEGYRAYVARWPARSACLVILGGETVDVLGLAAALEQELFPVQPAGAARVGAQLAAFVHHDGAFTLPAANDWRWVAAEGDELHAFLPHAVPGSAAQVAAFFYVRRQDAKQWAADLRRSLDGLAPQAAPSRLVRVRLAASPGP